MKNLNEKFQSLVNGSTHNMNGVCGTRTDVRMGIVKEVYSALPKTINVSVNGVNGVNVSMVKQTSISGKTVYFSASITNEQYLSIAPDAPCKKKGGASIMLDPNGVVEVRNGGKFFFKIENKNVVIN